MNKHAGLINKLFLAAVALTPFYLPLAVWAASNFGSIYVFSAWKELLLALLILAVAGPLTVILAKADKTTRILCLLIVAYVLLNLLYVVATDNLFEFTAGLLFSTRFLLFFLVALALAAYGGLRTEVLSKIIIVCGLVLAGVAILQVSVLPPDALQHLGYEPPGVEIDGFPPAYTTLGEVDDFIRPQATLRGPNALGAFLVLPYALLLSQLLRASRLSSRKLLAAAVIMVALLLTLSRSAWIAAALVTLVLFLARYRASLQQVSKKYLAVGLVLVACLAVFSLSNKTVRLVVFREDVSTSDRVSDSIRSALTREAWQDVKDHPLGRGPGNAGPVSVLDETDSGRIAENYFLQVAQETGWLGLALFAAIHAWAAKRLWELRGNRYALIALAVLVGLTFTNLTLHTWADDAVSITWWVFAGSIIGKPIIKSLKRSPV